MNSWRTTLIALVAGGLIGGVVAYQVGLKNGRNATPTGLDGNPESAKVTAESENPKPAFPVKPLRADPAKTPSVSVTMKEPVEHPRKDEPVRTTVNEPSPVEALSYALEQEDKDDKQNGIRKAIAAMDLAEVQETIHALDDVAPGPDKKAVQLSLIRRWAQLDGMAALEFADAEKQPKLRHELKIDALQGWALAEPLQAMKYVELNPYDDLPPGAMTYVFNGVKDAEPADALAFLETIDSAKHSMRVMDVVYEMFQSHPQDVVGWVEDLPPGKLRDDALHRTIDHWARYDPLAAKEWMEENTEDHNRTANYIELGESWARVDPQAAVDWFGGLPADQQSPQIVDRIFKRWIQYESETAGQWLEQQQPSPVLDRPIADYANTLGRQDPEKGLDWAAKIQDDRLRNRQITSITYRWIYKDPEASIKYLETANLPQTTRDRLMKAAQDRFDKQRQNLSERG